MHFLLALRLLMPESPGPERLRADHRSVALGAAGPTPDVGAVHDVKFDGPTGRLLARLYTPPNRSYDEGRPLPLLVYYHGGGFVVGDLDAVDGICRMLCANAGVYVFSVDYRLAPEHPFPAPVDDCDAAFQWAQRHAARWGADPMRVAVGGDSAGATLAAVVSQRAVARQRRQPEATVPAAQLLIYPSTHYHGDYHSRRAFRTGFFLEEEDMERFFHHYVASAGGTGHEPEVSPLMSDNLTGLPPTLVVTAAFDPLRDEAEAYAAQLAEAGVPVLLRRVPEMLHGFFNVAGVSGKAHEAVIATAGALSAMLSTHSVLPRDGIGVGPADLLETRI